MPRKQEAVISSLCNIPSPDLLIQFHQAKSKKDNRTAEQINDEFLRRDRVKVNESILGKPTVVEIGETPVVEIVPIVAKKHTPRKTNSKNCPTHCFCMHQSALFGALETKMCCRCGKELSVNGSNN